MNIFVDCATSMRTTFFDFFLQHNSVWTADEGVPKNKRTTVCETELYVCSTWSPLGTIFYFFSLCRPQYNFESCHLKKWLQLLDVFVTYESTGSWLTTLWHGVGIVTWFWVWARQRGYLGILADVGISNTVFIVGFTVVRWFESRLVSVQLYLFL